MLALLVPGVGMGGGEAAAVDHPVHRLAKSYVMDRQAQAHVQDRQAKSYVFNPVGQAKVDK